MIALAGCAPQPHRLEPETATVIRLQHAFDGPATHRVLQLSPDGRRVAALQSQGEAINLVVTELSGARQWQATAFRQRRVAGFMWAGNERLVFYLEDTRNLLAVDRDGGRQRVLNPDGRLLQVVRRLPGEPNRLLVAEYDPGARRANLLHLDTVSGRSRRLAKGPPGQWPSLWFTDRRGQLRGCVVNDGTRLDLWHYRAQDRAWNVSRSEAVATASLIPVDAPAEGSMVYAWVAAGAPPHGVHGIDLATGRVGEAVADLPGLGCCAALVSAGDERPVAFYSAPGLPWGVSYLDPRAETAATRAEALLEGRRARFLQWLEGAQRALLMAVSPVQDPDYYLLDMESGALSLLASAPAVLTPLRALQQEVREEFVLVNNRRPVFEASMTELPGPGRPAVDAVSSRPATTGTGNP